MKTYILLYTLIPLMLCACARMPADAVDAPSWTTLETVEQSSTRQVALAVDAANVPRLAFLSIGAVASLHYRSGDEPAEVVMIASDQQDADIALDLALSSSGLPGVVSTDAVSGALTFAERSAGSWVVETIEEAGRSTAFPSLVYDADDRPHISFFDARENDLRYATREAGTWRVETVDASGEPGFHLPGGVTRIALAGNPARPAIAFQSYRYAPGDGALRYATREAWGWRVDTVDATTGVGGPLALVVDRHGAPWISYHRAATWDYARGELRLARLAHGAWQRSVLDRRGNAGRFNALTLLDGERPVVASYDAAGGDLHLFWQDQAWRTARLGEAGDVGAWVRLAAADDGTLHLAFVDADAGRTRHGTLALPGLK